MLVTLDLVRALVAIALPFVTQIWEIYILIFVLQSASAAFTPTFQATIPDILPDEREYTRALSLSRLAYDLESVISPMLAAAADGHELPQSVCRYGGRVPRLCGSGCFRDVAKDESVNGQTQHL
jgi:MFS family permease